MTLNRNWKYLGSSLNSPQLYGFPTAQVMNDNEILVVDERIFAQIILFYS
jgi:hypothetical protein